MKTIKYLLMMSFMFIGIVLFAQDSKEDAGTALEFFGLSGFWTGVVLTAITIVGKMIPKKAADWMYHIGKLWNYITEHTNRTSPSEKAEKEGAKKVLKDNNFPKAKVLTVAVIILLGSMSVSAQQSKWAGFFEPIDQVIHEMEISKGPAVSSYQYIVRPAWAINAYSINVSDKTPSSSSFTSAGAGISYGKFTKVDDKAYCNFSVNGLLMTSIKVGDTVETNFGIGATVDVFDKAIGLGAAYIGKDFFILIPVSISF